MAIAPLPQQEELALFEMPWPKPALRVEPDRRLSGAYGPHDDGALATITDLFPEPVGVSRPDHNARARVVVRRRIALGAVVVGLLLAIALPLQSLGAVTKSGVSTPDGVASGLGDGTPYVVRSGDTLASIARQINPNGNQAALVAQMQAEVGSSVVVPGEHLLLP